MTERATSTVVALEIDGERIEVELDAETFDRITRAVDAARRARSRARESQLERIVARYLAAHPEASANAVHRALGGRRGSVLRAVQAVRKPGATSDPTQPPRGAPTRYPCPGTGTSDDGPTAVRA